MLTRETKFIVKWTGWEVKFSVYDNKDWLVSLSNEGEEVGATSDFCNSNWDKGLAEVFAMVADDIDFFDAIDLLNSLKKDDRIDNAFIKYLPANWKQCVDFDEIEESLENDNLFIDLY